MFPVDYHMHTNISDGKADHLSMLRAAEAVGLREIGFSDHVTFFDAAWSANRKRLDEMVAAVDAVHQTSKSVIVKLGAEMDYVPGKEAQIVSMIDNLPLDYVIGSVHFMGDWNFDTNPEDYAGKDFDKLYNDYFILIQDAARCGLFDVIGHVDLIKKFSVYPSFPMQDIYEKTATIFKQSGVVVEVNTSGITKQCKEIYPSYDFLKELKRQKVPVTLGSDAHTPEAVGQHFNHAIGLLKYVGYTHVVQFIKRRREKIAL
ncbi:histidinol-phosphatase HisJ family protein [Williamwhitmania taraxaci]|uniref:Histidinol-phosphatase n=1 Tax=Williamwhitmania taraxaci TaxID=1640674 RepID=A0A1G6H8D0_9BACT|nr:histidinol-phosphatase HisJ family protein [Williamwhitmania taraxaci]SDB90348.1 histidinol-phosphate phosphatase [Williamwhitmania taraxaci]